MNAADPTAPASGERGADQTAADLIAAVLAVTPRGKDGSVITEYATCECTYDCCTEHYDADGPAEPIAARQAVAVLRWAATWLGEPWMERNAGSLDDLADAIEAAR